MDHRFGRRSVSVTDPMASLPSVPWLAAKLLQSVGVIWREEFLMSRVSEFATSSFRINIFNVNDYFH